MTAAGDPENAEDFQAILEEILTAGRQWHQQGLFTLAGIHIIGERYGHWAPRAVIDRAAIATDATEALKILQAIAVMARLDPHIWKRHPGDLMGTLAKLNIDDHIRRYEQQCQHGENTRPPTKAPNGNDSEPKP